jgi:hypothetical protein
MGVGVNTESKSMRGSDHSDAYDLFCVSHSLRACIIKDLEEAYSYEVT